MKNIFSDLVDGKRILREIAIIQKLNHPNIVKITDLFYEGDPNTFQDLYVVLECADSDLKKLLKSNLNLKTKQINKIAVGLLEGIQYLHSKGILHRDLKPANVLLYQDCRVKICDFGLSRSLENEFFSENKQDNPDKLLKEMGVIIK
jgi:mitogen-activated protein kinase 1/3